MIMKIINTAREITFFAGSKPKIFAKIRGFSRGCEKRRKGRQRLLDQVARHPNPYHHFFDPKMMNFSILIEKLKNSIFS